MYCFDVVGQFDGNGFGIVGVGKVVYGYGFIGLDQCGCGFGGDYVVMEMCVGDVINRYDDSVFGGNFDYWLFLFVWGVLFLWNGFFLGVYLNLLVLFCSVVCKVFLQFV